MFGLKKSPKFDRAVLYEQPPLRMRRCRHGVFMYNIHDEYIGRALDLYGEFCELENNLFQGILKPGMTALDVGANIGAHTVNFARAVGPAGSVFAFEPQRVVHQMLCGNVALNALENVTVVRAGVGKKLGTIAVPLMNFKAPNNFGGVSLGGQGGEPVPSITLDSMELKRCDFIKIDVEGMEQEVLEGAAKTLGKYRPVLYVENDRVEKSEALLHCMLGLGYRLYWDAPPLFNPDNYFGNKENIYPNLSSINVLAIPKEMQFPMPPGAEEITEKTAHLHSLKH